jgi:hypothetical protein
MARIPNVVEVRPVGGYGLFLRFDDGVEGVIDFTKRLDFTGVFEPLADPAAFAEVRLRGGTLEWPNGADLDEVVLHSVITGDPIPEAEGAPNPLAER